jgi:hypothetical protein
MNWFRTGLSKREHLVGCHLREGGHPGIKWYRALCARSQNLIAVPRTAGGFLSLLVQRKKPKKARPGAADCFLRFSPTPALA